MDKIRIVIGSRGSQLALWQAHWIEARLQELGADTRIEIIKTTGDKITDVPLNQVGGKGLFTKEIEDALLAGTIDVAVHSLKDVPTELPPGLHLAAIPERELPFDALLGCKLDDLPQGARVGTSSLRRAAQLKASRPDLVVESLRGNLDTRVRKLEEGQYDAIVLAAAGLRRLGWADKIAEVLMPDRMCPAVGQGALGIETRNDGGPADRLVRQLDHKPTRQAILAERSFLERLGGGCQVPIGAYAREDNGSLRLQVLVVHPSGDPILRHEIIGQEPDSLGAEAAEHILKHGGQSVLAEVYNEPLYGQTLVLTRAWQHSGPMVSAIARAGLRVIEMPAIDFEPLAFVAPDMTAYDWVIFTSATAVDFFFRTAEPSSHPRYACIGSATAQHLREHGLQASLVPEDARSEGLAAALVNDDLSGKRVLFPRAEVSSDIVPAALRERGAEVDLLPVYRNVVPQDLPRRSMPILAAAPDWICFSSGSAVKNVLSATPRTLLDRIKVACIGPATAEVARMHGLRVHASAAEPTTEALLAAMRASLSI